MKKNSETSLFREMGSVDFQLLFESSPHPYLILLPDPEFTIIAVNNCYLHATQTTREGIVGRSLFDVFPDNPSDSTTSGESDLRASLERVLREKIQDSMGVQKYDIPIKDSNQFEEKYWSPINTPVLNEEGEIEVIIHRAEDVTEYIKMRRHQTDQQRVDQVEAEVLRSSEKVKEANRQLKLVNKKLEQREQELSTLNKRMKELDVAKTKFFSNVSHEFRTPLTLILGPLEEALQEPTPILSLKRERLEVIYRNALRLLKLVNNLLDFSKIEAGKMKVSYQEVDLGSFTAELASMFQSTADKAGLRFIIHCPKLEEPVYLDLEMWEKIVLNLISNAFKYTQKGTIEINLELVGNNIKLIVRDTGLGIPKDQLPLLFKRFNRMSNIHPSHEGTGIGLALVKELVNLHGGEVTVESEPEKGSCFVVSLPKGKAGFSPKKSPYQINMSSVSEILYSPSDKNSVEKTSESDHKKGIARWQTVNGREVNILLADDNADMRQYIERLLAPYCKVKVVSNGELALEAALADPPDLVLSDIMMPKIDGMELLSLFRSNDRLKMIPFILLSAQAGEEAKVGALQSGADDYLVKPFNANELLARVKANLNFELQTLNHQLQLKYNELERINKKLRDINQFENEFITTVNHELRTPLTSIRGSLGLLLSGVSGNLPDKMLHLIEIANRNCERLILLINDILDLKKIESGQMKFDLKQVNLKDFIIQAFELNRSYCEKFNVLLKVHEPLLDISILVDFDRLMQVITNLISNAAKFSEKGGEIEISVVEKGKYVRVAVTDHGCGIPKKFHSKIFGKFMQADNASASQKGGTGLGLCISKSIIENLRGEIGFVSKVNSGSTFYFDLPRSS